MKKLAIFASGRGSNALKIFDYLTNNDQLSVACILSNRSISGIINSAKELQIPHLVFNKREFNDSKIIKNYLSEHEIDFIVLAGFLWLIPAWLIHLYPDKILNIHPALLPKYGGKGMYGSNIHKAVKENEDNVSGITIHLVNKDYDEGRIVLQSKVALDSKDSVHDIAHKVLTLEHHFYLRVIEGFCQ